MQRKIKNKGFTLVEILVSIVVLGVLSGIGYPVYQDYVAKGQIGQLAPLLAESRLDVESHAMLSGQFTLNKIKSEFDPKLLASQTIKDGVITFTFKDEIGSRLSGKKYSFTPTYEDENIIWSCETDVNTKLDPFHCKGLIGGGGDVNGGDVIASLEDGRVQVIRNHAGGETVTCAGMEGGSNFEYNGNSYYVVKDMGDFKDYAYGESWNLKDSFFSGRVCTTHITDMNYFFYNVDLGEYDLSDWDTSNVTDMENMFMSSQFNGDISGWDVSNVTDISGMFSYSQFNGDISGWDVSNVADMRWMFSGTQFNQDIGSWDVSNVTDMSGMFEISQFNQDIGGWDVSNVTDMSSMFGGAENFNQDLSGWCVSRIATKPEKTWSGGRDFDGGAVSWQEEYRPVWGTCPNK